MKKFGLVLIAFLATSGLMAQKFGYIDTDYILSKMPDFQSAQAELDKLSTGWQQEIQDNAKEIEALYASLKAEEVLLTADMKEQRSEEISKKEAALKEYQNEIFGFEGLYFLKKEELVKPIQDQVFEAAQKVARENRLSMIFDKAADLVMIYTDPRYDYTDFVLDELGLGDPSDVLK